MVCNIPLIQNMVMDNALHTCTIIMGIPHILYGKKMGWIYYIIRTMHSKVHFALAFEIDMLHGTWFMVQMRATSIVSSWYILNIPYFFYGTYNLLYDGRFNFDGLHVVLS